MYIPFTEIQAITDHGFGSNEPVEPVPTLLQLKRNLADWAAELRSGFGVAIAVECEMQSEHLGTLEALRAHCIPITTSIAGDREAYKAFARAVQSIRLAVADEPSVKLSGGRLQITTCLSIVDRMRTTQIQDAVEALL